MIIQEERRIRIIDRIAKEETDEEKNEVERDTKRTERKWGGREEDKQK